jgi:hemolysin III
MELLVLREPASALTHGAGLLLAIPATLALCRGRHGDHLQRLALWVYGLTLLTCYGASALYHGVRTSPEGLLKYALFDQVGIFLLIAGSYTPIAVTLFRGAWRRNTLLAAWSTAVFGSALEAASGILSPAISTVLYLAFGWGALICYTELARIYSHRRLWLILGGGVLYTVGAILNLLRWPVPWPGVFGSHEVFHLFVIAGSATHYGFMWAMIRFPAPAAMYVPRPLGVRSARKRWRTPAHGR